jgi:hypothetical protein
VIQSATTWLLIGTNNNMSHILKIRIELRKGNKSKMIYGINKEVGTLFISLDHQLTHFNYMSEHDTMLVEYVIVMALFIHLYNSSFSSCLFCVGPIPTIVPNTI